MEWDDKKSSQKDTDARWVKKNGVSFFGYKNHIKTDAGTSLVNDYRVTTASTHDSVVLKKFVSESDSSKPLYSDRAYMGEEIEQMLKDLKIENKVCEKGRRGAPLTDAQRRHNRQKSKIRAMVEHVFGVMENSMNGIFLRCIGIKRATCKIGLANLTYNICRYAQPIHPNRVQDA